MSTSPTPNVALVEEFAKAFAEEARPLLRDAIRGRCMACHGWVLDVDTPIPHLCAITREEGEAIELVFEDVAEMLTREAILRRMATNSELDTNMLEPWVVFFKKNVTRPTCNVTKRMVKMMNMLDADMARVPQDAQKLFDWVKFILSNPWSQLSYYMSDVFDTTYNRLITELATMNEEDRANNNIVAIL